ncbi:MAG: hypothetical protein IJH12_10440 [Clostridia bacterium]|nr:hypothetical protein [Clostridia bacterium]
MDSKKNKEDIIKIIIFAGLIVILSILAILVHTDYELEKKNTIINAEDFPINNFDENRAQEIQGTNGVYYYELEDYGDFQEQ